MKLLLVFLCNGALGQMISFGWRKTCPEIPVIADFSVEQYKGKWYEQARYNVPFQDKKAKCTTATYGDRDDTSVSVNNTQIVPVKKWRQPTQWRLGWGEGQAIQSAPEEHPNRLDVTFNIDNAIGSWFASLFSTSYDVLEVDYDTYAMVYNCQNYFGFLRVEYAWILSRDQSFRETDQYGELKEKFAEMYGLKLMKLLEGDQSNCDYDFSDETEVGLYV